MYVSYFKYVEYIEVYGRFLLPANQATKERSLPRTILTPKNPEEQ